MLAILGISAGITWIVYLLARVGQLKLENDRLSSDLDARNQMLIRLYRRHQRRQREINELADECAVLKRSRIVRLPIYREGIGFTCVLN